MKHWSVDEKKFKKDPTAYAIWQLEQRINFGIGRKKIKRSELKRYWKKLDLDPKRKIYLESLVWGPQS
jgi:hypothetical protein